MSKNTSIYKNSEIEAKIMSMYDTKLARWPVPHECISVPTRYGITNVIASGPKDAPPVILVHAMGVTATMWLPNILALSRHFRTYAIDTIGDIGKSSLHQLDNYPKNGQAYSVWLEEVFDKLGIEQANVIGSSMGGWISMNLAIHAAPRVKHLVLLGPQGIAANYEVLFRLFSVVFFPTKANKRSLIQWILGENTAVREALEEYMYTAVNCRGKMAPPKKLANEQLGKITAPTLLFVGKSDPTFNAQKDIDRVMMAIPNIQVEIMPGTSHMMSTENPEFVNNRILSFLLS